MTDLTPGSRWLLPVTYMLTSSRYGMEFDTSSDTVTISHEDCESLIPANRITELEAENAELLRKNQRLDDELGRFQGLYDAARGDVVEAEMKAERLKSELEKLK